MEINYTDDATARAIRDLVDREGGYVDPESIGAVLQRDDFLHALVSIDFLQKELTRTSVDNGGPPVSVHLTRSTSMGALVAMAGPGHAVVLLPVGTLGRLQVVHRLLLSYWGRDEPVPVMVASIKDRPFERRLPRALLPLLDDLSAVEDRQEWWHALDEIDRSIELSEAYAPDVSELNHLALSLLLSHEFAHVARHHHDVQRRVRAGELTFEIGQGDQRRAGTIKELRRAIENDADRVAAYLVLLTLVRQVAGDVSVLPTGFLRLGYALSALLALFDPRRLSLMTFGAESSYPHPLVRLDGYLHDIATCAKGLELEPAFGAFAVQGTRRCLDALQRLEFDIYAKRRFCSDGETPEPIVHALRAATMSSEILVQRERIKEEALTLRLNTLITSTYGEFRF